MSSTRELVKEIEQAMRPAARGDVARLAGLAQAYVDACERLCERAWRCRDFVEKGLRHAALKIVAAVPELREELKAVDFAALPEWLDICETLGLATPPILETDAIALVIDQVYVKTPDSGRLLAFHRRLALGRAPLQERINVLRALCRADAQNPVWAEDLLSYEAAHIEEIRNEAVAAGERGDLEALDALLGRLRSKDWSLEPPKALAAWVERRAEPHRRRVAGERYARIAEDARLAHAAMDEQRCRALLREVEEVSSRTRRGPEGEPARQISVMRDWVDDLQREHDAQTAYAKSLVVLENSLDESVSLEALERMAAHSLSFERGMPAALAARLQSRIEELQRHGRRRFALALTAVVGLLMLVAAGTALAVAAHRRSVEVAEWDARITAALDAGDVEGAGRLVSALESQKPQVYSASAVQESVARYKSAEGEEVERQERFATMIAGMDDDIVASNDFSDRLAQLALLARSAEEKAEVERWRLAKDRDDEVREPERKSKFMADLDELTRLYQELSRPQALATADLEQRVDECLGRARELAERAGKQRLSADLLAGAAGMVQAVDLLAHRVRARAREQRQIESLIRRSGGLFLKPDELAGALGDFSKAFPANPLSADFVVAVRMAPFWGAYADWESAAAGWRDAPCVKDASTARERLTKIEDIVTRRGASLPTERAEDYVAYLQHSQRVLAGRSYAAGISEIESILHSSLMRSLYVVCVSAGDGSELVYYTRSNLLKGTGSVTGPDGRTLRTYGFDYVVDGSLATTYEVVDTGSLLSKPNLSPAPQTALAEQALIIIGEFRLSGAGWETLDLQLAEMTAACPDIDPILRANLMRIFLDRAVAFVPFERDAVNTLAERIRKIDNDVRWIDPYDIQANNVRAHVSSELERIGSLSGLVKAVQDRISLAAGPRPVAVMLGPDMSVSAVGTLFVMRQDSPSKARFEKIGEAKDGKMALDEGAECPCGSIIYAGR